MDKENVHILQPQELIDAVNQGSGQTAEQLRQQCTTLELLSGTLMMSFGVNSAFFTGMLGELALQSSFMSAQLGEQQLYDAAAMESAAATYLLVNTLSTNVDGMVASLAGLSGFVDAISKNVDKILPLLEKGGSGGILSTVFSGVSALGAIPALLGALPTVMPIILSVVGFLGIATALFAGIFAVSNLINKKPDNNQDQVTGENGVKDQTQPQAQTQATVQNSSISTTQTIDTVQAAIDPFNTKQGENSAYSKYQNYSGTSELTAETLRSAVETGNSAVAEQLGEVADKLKELAGKPADRNVTSNIVIESLHTTATYQQFVTMLEEVLGRGVQETA